MNKTINNLALINNEIKSNFGFLNNLKIIAVSKTFGMDSIMPLIENGHIHFGENKVQEALDKWSDIKKKNKNLKIHMIGKLQTNKVKHVVPLFDYIHSLDNLKLAQKISKEQKKYNKNLKIFIQINIGNESQKAGLDPKNLDEFYNKCVSELELDIVGLMCIPPNDDNTKFYFDKMFELKKLFNLPELSMGMSSDYIQAVEYGSTFLRIGSKIFGARD